MNLNLLDLATQALAPQIVDQIGKQLGLNNSMTRNVISSALPLLVSGLVKNAGSKKGTDSLFKAVQQKHDGGIFGQMEQLIQQPEAGEGNGILRHILGGKRPMVENNIGKATGANPIQISKVMQILAPVVLGVIGQQMMKKKVQKPADLSGLLQNTQQVLGKRSGSEMGIVGRLLDSDNDGKIIDNVAGIGLKLLGNFMRR